ncbi:response regulator [Chloroflexia bacterium SDU3-3]|nr:response regulator [Chloroflexia bacterium SDU3-3]
MSAPLQRVMMVEDEPDIQTIAQMALEVLGQFTVEICSSGPEALAKAPIFHPDIILLDVMMPMMDGPTTLSELRANPATAGIPVIFMTAKVQSHEIAQYQAMGALDVISKPFDPMRLPANIREIWARSCT